MLVLLLSLLLWPISRIYAGDGGEDGAHITWVDTDNTTWCYADAKNVSFLAVEHQPDLLDCQFLRDYFYTHPGFWWLDDLNFTRDFVSLASAQSCRMSIALDHSDAKEAVVGNLDVANILDVYMKTFNSSESRTLNSGLGKMDCDPDIGASRSLLSWVIDHNLDHLPNSTQHTDSPHSVSTRNPKKAIKVVPKSKWVDTRSPQSLCRPVSSIIPLPNMDGSKIDQWFKDCESVMQMVGSLKGRIEISDQEKTGLSANIIKQGSCNLRGVVMEEGARTVAIGNMDIVDAINWTTTKFSSIADENLRVGGVDMRCGNSMFVSRVKFELVLP